MDLTALIHEAAAGLDDPTRAAFGRLLDGEFVARLASRLERYAKDGVPTERPLPHLSVETTPPMSDAVGAFKPVLELLANTDRSDAWQAQVTTTVTAALHSIGAANLLVVLGMRVTPASLRDQTGTPPSRALLIESATAQLDDGQGLSAVARALDKHAQRSTEPYWGKPAGGVAQKNAAALELVERILDTTTWWNVFGHFQHGTVFEARIATGHGARWGQAGATFIGFLEPFDETKGALGDA